jgi:hypothetical protein|tara:strand:- start:92 stop:271 length:180 start_codon:yes stop_codon:yes gene_type:complete
MSEQRLTKVTVKEICDKYPDKVIKKTDGTPLTYERGKNVVLQLDTCKIIFTEKGKDGVL